MGLGTYIQKRNFKKTNEPKAGKSTGKRLVFVVQRHHASSLHYDFRLELDGVLKSWAVPKGPSLNPKDKRLAMMVEDHPYDYRTFEGVIPEGNYGAGLVHIFDEGYYESLAEERKQDIKELKNGLASGNLKIRLHGKILKGEFALVKLKNTDDKSWLLIKHRDEYAVDKPFNAEDLVPQKIIEQGIDIKKKSGSNKKSIEDVKPGPPSAPLKRSKATAVSAYKPMLAKLSKKIFDDDSWLYEKKIDGYRIIAVTGENGILTSRRGIDYSSKYKVVLKTLQKSEKDAVIDGEMVVEDKHGHVLFQELQNYNPLNKNTVLKYYAFDLLSLDGYDLTGMELMKRKQLLRALIENISDKNIIYNDHVIGKGTELLKRAEKEGWEGIIGKEIHSTYIQDKRSDKWLKFKLQNSQEAIIIGYSKPAGSRKYFGSLALGIYEDTELVYIGNCGTGFNEASLKSMYNLMRDLATDKKPVKGKVKQERSITWLKPELVCEVTYSEWTADKNLRHPVFKGLRNDKTKENVTMEIPEISSKDSSDDIQEKPAEKELSFGNKRVKLTNLNKLYWKNENISKGQLIDYYRNIADYILPYLKDRPLSLNRHPNGIDAPGFFQKDLDTDQIPKWIKYAPLYSESTDKDIDYLICNDEPTLLWMANLGCIEVNPWLSTYKKPENPIFAVLDLDPNDVDDFGEVVRIALTAKNILERMGIKPFIKTSGSRGLHIFIHIGGKYDYDISKSFIEYLGHLIMKEHPETTSLERSPSKRKKKIYLDFLQNRRGQTIAAPYSVRPKPGATVSTPLDWSEVTENIDIKQFTIFNTLDRIKQKGDLWESITSGKADLKRGLKSLK
ncbi:MAG TPA: DNA ligase D [Sphingobacteriaceae bacterium]